MNHSKLYETAAALLATGKGVLAADESNGTMNKRLASINVPQEAENRRRFRIVRRFPRRFFATAGNGHFHSFFEHGLSNTVADAFTSARDQGCFSL